MRRILPILMVLALSVSSASVLAAPKPPQPDIRVEFDREELYVGQSFECVISVTAEGEGDPGITIPNLKGLEVLDKSVSRPSSGYSVSFSFGTGQNSQRVVKNSGTWVYRLVLRAKSAGKYTVGPVKVELDGHTFNGKTYPLEVLPASAANQVSSSATDTVARSGGGMSEMVLKDVKIDPEYFLHMIASREECFQGEMVVLDVYLFTSVRGIRNLQFEREPGTEGFWVERFEDMDIRSRQTERVMIGEDVYERVLLKKLALFPLKSGVLTIAPPMLAFSVGGGGFFRFSQGKTVKRAGQPISIQVNPLPEGAPVGFHSSNVGQYNLFAEVTPSEVKVGEPITLTLSVKGRGNVRNVVLPQVPSIDGVKMYDPETDAEVQVRRNQVSGMSQSKVLLIPEAEGEVSIPAISWSYFDPSTGSYRSREVKAVTVTVTPGANLHAGGAVVSGSAVRPSASALARMNSHMRTIEDSVDVSMSSGPIVNATWFVGVVFGVPFLFIGFALFSRLRRSARDNFEKGRSRRARPVAQKALAELAWNTRQMGNDAFYSELHKVLVTFLEDRLEEVVAGDTMAQLESRLRERGLGDDLAVEAVARIEECEFARFARTDGGAQTRQDEIKRAHAFVEQVGSAPLQAREGGRS